MLPFIFFPKLLITSLLLVICAACNKEDYSKSQHAQPVGKTVQKNNSPGGQSSGSKSKGDQVQGANGPARNPEGNVQANQRNCEAFKTMEKCIDLCIWMPVSKLCSSKPLTNVIKTGLASNAPAIFVKIGGESPSHEDGKTWSTAFVSLEEALSAHKNANELILVVAANTDLKLDTALHLNFFTGTKLELYGGFKGDEQDLSQIEVINDFPARPLVLDGNGKTRLFDAGFPSKQNPELKFFGVVFKNGHVKNMIGGALETSYTNLKLSYTKWIDNNANNGGAIHADNSVINIIGYTLFSGNSAEVTNGAISAIKSTVIIDAPTYFINNEAKGGGSGAMRLFDTELTVNAATIFKGNKVWPGAPASAFFSNKPVQGDVSKIVGAHVGIQSEYWEQSL